jgi:hypothetical protein
MAKNPDRTSYIELKAKESPFVDHKDYHKCGQCLKEMIRYQVACEFLRQGKISNDYIAEMEEEVKTRWQASYLFKEVTRLKQTGLTLEEAIKEMETRGYIP